jgi:methylase of polypeptide subunit release factors
LPDDAARKVVRLTDAPTPMILSDAEQAALSLLRTLDASGYAFTAPTPETHRRVVARASMRTARDLRGVFGWSLPFDASVVGPEILELMTRARLLRDTAAGLVSKVRASCVRGQLFLHSAYPTTSDESVFLGPDSIRFADFLVAELSAGDGVARLVDIGAGAGVGGIVAGMTLRDAAIELVDINRSALSLARVNAAHAGVAATTYESDAVAAVEPGFDVAIANPPFIIDENGPAYRAGGDMHGARLSLDWTLAAAEKVAPGGRVLLYTGSSIVGGVDGLRRALEDQLPALGCRLRYRELDPDIFGDQLDHPGYEEVERIAAIGAVVTRQ